MANIMPEVRNIYEENQDRSMQTSIDDMFQCTRSGARENARAEIIRYNQAGGVSHHLQTAGKTNLGR